MTRDVNVTKPFDVPLKMSYRVVVSSGGLLATNFEQLEIKYSTNIIAFFDCVLLLVNCRDLSADQLSTCGVGSRRVLLQPVLVVRRPIPLGA